MAAVFGLLTAVFTGLCLWACRWALPYAITFGTCCYHFAMRLLVGSILDRAMGNKADYRKRWYQPHPLEAQIYRLLRVKQWKGRMPTYDPASFDPRLHSWDEIAQAMCQAEVVHEVIIALSFLPLLGAIPFGTFGVFLITSVLAAGYDLCFVMMQRFNRPRILAIIQKHPQLEKQTDAQMESQIN